MKDYEAHRKSDIQHALVMAGILLALGSGAIFFLFVIHSYYMVNRSLRASRDFNRLVVDSMANGLLSVDPSGSVLSYNQPALQLLGVTPEEALSKNLNTVLDFKACGITDVLTGNKSSTDCEVRFQRQPGDTVVMGLSVSQLSAEEGGVRGAVIVIRDLSEIKALQEKLRQSEKLAAVGALAAGVAHEIRNPLSSIRGFSKFLHHSLVGKPREQEYTEVMVREIDRINQVVTELLDLARPMNVEPSATYLPDLLKHVAILVEKDAQKHRVTVSLEADDRLPRVFIDERLIKQALLNLVLNSLQACGSGGSIILGAEVSGFSQLNLWVQDNGKGISSENRKQIFDPFFTTRETGTGLGLAITSKIVEAHQGNVNMQSPPPGRESGCRVTILLPVHKEGHTV